MVIIAKKESKKMSDEKLTQDKKSYDAPSYRFEIIERIYDLFDDYDISLSEASSISQIILTRLQKFTHSLCKDTDFKDCRQKYQ